jgi:hypothetical protein
MPCYSEFLYRPHTLTKCFDALSLTFRWSMITEIILTINDIRIGVTIVLKA